APAGREMPMEAGEIVVAPDEGAGRDRDLRRPAEEPVALTSDRLEEPRCRRILAERGAHLSDADAHDARADGDVRPYGAKELGAGHEPAGMLGQVAEQGERLSPQRSLDVPAPQPPV